MTTVEGMVEEIKGKYGLDAPNVFRAMLQVPREKFVDSKFKNKAYQDSPVSLGYGQTMSQPYTVAFMTDLLGLKGGESVLEIGTGSGYQAAVLSHLAKKIYSIEVIPELAKAAHRRLKKLGYKNVKVKQGSGEWGWEEHAPYEAIIVTAGLDKNVPSALFDQLRDGGVLVVPVGTGDDKQMTKFTKIKNGEGTIKKEEHGIFHFVPFVKEPG